MQKAICTIFVVLLVTAAAFGQAPPTTQRVSDLLAALHAARWSDRAAAYEQLRNDAEALRKPEVKSALLDLVDRENQADWSKESDFDPQYNEAHAEYLGELGDTVDSLADWRDPHEVCILAHQTYNTDSVFAGELAAAGQTVIPCLMQMAQSESYFDRRRAVPVLVQLRAKNSQLSPQTVQKISQVTIAALHDPRIIVRVVTIAALQDFGSRDMIPALREVTETDPAPEVNGASVRKYAMNAITAIEKRSGK